MQWNNMTVHDQDNFVSNVVGHLGAVTSDTIKNRQLAVFARANATLAQRIAKGINVTMS
jgi:catalase